MKIKTQVSISLIVFVILAVVILFSYFSSNNQLHEIQKNQQIISDIEKSSFELYYLENDYLIRGGTLQIERWNAKYAELTRKISELTLTDPSEQDVLKDLVKSHKELNTSFSNLVAVTSGLQGKEPTGTSQEIKEFSAGTLAGQTQTLMSRALELSQLVRVKANEVEQRTSLIISSSIAVLMVFVLLNYLLINRSVLKSISTLRKGSERIGSGDLDTKIEIQSHDEMGELSVTITEMASNLKTVLTSKSALEKEVAERKLAQEQLKEREEKFRQLFTRMPSAVAIYEAVEDGNDFIFRDFNSAAEKIEGIKKDDLIGRRVTQVFPGVRDFGIFPVFSRVWRTGEPEFFPSAIYRDERDPGTWRESWVYKLASGEIVTIYNDITERKRAEEALKEHDEKIHLLLDSTAEAIYGLDINGNCMFCNNSCLRLLGYKHPRELLGKNMHWQIHAKYPDGTHFPVEECRIYKAFNKGEGTHVDDEVLWRSDGTSFPAEYWSYPQRRDGVVIGAVVTFIDITERKELEKEMKCHALELRQFSTSLAVANKKLNLLSSITRHDINNQMTVLMGYLTILKKKQPDPALNEYFVKVSNAAQRISSMVQFTKEYEKIGVDSPTWQECRTLVDTAAKQTPLGKVVVKNDLPGGAEVFADPLVVKVFYNLMDNAIRYGGKIMTIRFSVEEAGDCHLIVCEDDGEGVVAEEKEKIFERGFGKNTGLGLALSREILAITGIKIRETGKPGKGARFEMTVPKGAYRISSMQ